MAILVCPEMKAQLQALASHLNISVHLLDHPYPSPDPSMGAALERISGVGLYTVSEPGGVPVPGVGGGGGEGGGLPFLPFFEERTCSRCGVSESEKKLSKCTGCRQVQYCGKTCQAADWKGHKKSCKWEAARGESQ